jgi:phospholipid-binding lipoprotein MlaA
MMRWAKSLVMLLLLCGAAGCATTGPADPRDPLEGMNRAVYAFNDGLDKVVVKPLAVGYKAITPDPIRTWVRNFFANLVDPWIGVNNLLQGKPGDAVVDWARFAFNTTLGIFGINDVASTMGLEKHDEDLGQTLGRWGMDEGAYLIIPFWGSSSMRDGLGLMGDLYVDPVWRHRPTRERNVAVALRYTSRRADLLDASRILEEAALDKYVFQRDAYLQRRRSQVYDGNPPRAERDSPRADAETEIAPAAQQPAGVDAQQPVSQVLPSENIGSAVRLLEDPASHAVAGGG